MKSHEAYRGIYSQYLKQNQSRFFDVNINEIMADFEERIQSFKFDPKGIKEKPVVLDLGCYDFPHYYAMYDYFENFTYIGVETHLPKEIKAIVELIQEKYGNFHLLKMDIADQEKLKNKLAELTGHSKADVILVEQLAVRDEANSKETDQLLKNVIQHLAPAILSESGVLHLEAASSHQIETIKKWLDDEQTRGLYDYTKNGDNFLCWRAGMGKVKVADFNPL